jgi:hypothetical protein
VSARTSLAKFLDELIPATAGRISRVTIESADLAYFETIGLRFTGAVFSTIPATDY